MALIFAETWEAGTNGNACTRVNTGWNQFINNWTFSNAHVVSGQGTLGGHFSIAAAAAQAQVVFTAATRVFLSFPLYPVSAPSVNVNLAGLRGGGNTTNLAQLQFTTDRRLALRNSGFISILQSPAGLVPLNAQGRVEWMLDSATDQQRLRWFSNPTSATPDYDSGLVNTTAVGTIDTLSLGAINSATWEAYIGDVNLDGAAWPSFGGTGTGTVNPRAFAANPTTGSGTTATITMPTTGPGGTPVAGDLAVLTFIGGSGAWTQTGPGGWLQIAHQAAPGIGLDAWAKVLVGGDLGATLTVTSNNTAALNRDLYVDIFTGAQLGQVASALGTVASAAHTTPPATAVDPNAWVLNVVGDEASPASTAWTLAANLTLRNQLFGTGGGSVSSVAATDDNVGSGSVGSNTITGTVPTVTSAALTAIIEPSGATLGQTVNCGSDQTLEPWVTGTVAATISGSPTSVNWTQVGPISPALSLSGATTATVTFPTPANIAQQVYKLRCTATYASGSPATGNVTVTVLPVTERFVDASGTEVPLRSFTVT